MPYAAFINAFKLYCAKGRKTSTENGAAELIELRAAARPCGDHPQAPFSSLN